MDIPPWEMEEQQKWTQQTTEGRQKKVEAAKRRRGNAFLVTTSETISGRNTLEVGLVRGCAVLARNFVLDGMADIDNALGGEVQAYTTLVDNSSKLAMNRMVAEAKNYDADAVIGVRFQFSEFTNGASAVIAYGTAVVFE